MSTIKCIDNVVIVRYYGGIINVIMKDTKYIMNTTDPLKAIECPECGSFAELHVYPSPVAGLWGCTNDECKANDYCEHEERHVDGDVYVCDACEDTLPDDPAVDAFDRKVDMEIMESLGK